MANSMKKKGSTIILKGVADQETWILHAFFGMLGTLNDINVLNRSPLMNKIANGETTPVEFVANGHTYYYDYYLANDNKSLYRQVSLLVSFWKLCY